MRRGFFPIVLLLLFWAEMAVIGGFALGDAAEPQDVVAVNEIRYSVQKDWGRMERHRNETELDYVVLDAEGKVLFRTRPGLSESVHQAIMHRDTVLTLPGWEHSDAPTGNILIWNDDEEKQQAKRKLAAAGLCILISVQTGICILYHIYLQRNVVSPFRKLKEFARRIAGGNMDIPLEMDRYNLFGAFTESFDIMRVELKKARRAEAQANAAKKELVAKLSHDIKTPVASIQAAAEVGAALAHLAEAGDSQIGEQNGIMRREEILCPKTERGEDITAGCKNPRLTGIRENYQQIIRKAEQINTLVGNLFTAALEEMEQLTVTPGDMSSGELRDILESADYLRRAVIPTAPECLVYADRLRLQQVFDNLFANSYKYANTKIEVKLLMEEGYLAAVVEDYGGGVEEEELPLLKEKFRRGSNAKAAEGAGLGLYISDYFMKAMQGELLAENGEKGLKVTARIRLSGWSALKKM